MKFQISTPRHRRQDFESHARPQSGFTMVEIALCLAIIGFALIAIIGVLPTGLNVQKDNREETIIDQDAVTWLDAIRSGGRGYDDLTNYVIAITNYVWHYKLNGAETAYTLDSPAPDVYAFTPTRWFLNGAVQTGDQFLLTNGMHIIGALSRPKIEWDPNFAPYAAFYRNYVVANVRSMSGSAVEKYPQTNTTVLDAAFSYRMVPQIEAYLPFDTNLVRATVIDPLVPYDLSAPPSTIQVNEGPNPFDLAPLESTNYGGAYWDQVRANRSALGMAYTNSHDLRLTFRWPLLPNGSTGVGRHTFRVFVGGHMMRTNDPTPGVLNYPLYFFQPSTYAQ
jgi:type II secretory pathway pseudopilin PulG